MDNRFGLPPLPFIEDEVAPDFKWYTKDKEIDKVIDKVRKAPEDIEDKHFMDFDLDKIRVIDGLMMY